MRYTYGYEVSSYVQKFVKKGTNNANSRGEAFHTNDWTWQAKMMDALITALERSMVGFKYGFHLKQELS